MTLAIVLLAAMLVMAVAPTREQLAREILSAAARDQNKECCLDAADDALCVLPKSHKGEHRHESIRKIIPL